MYVCMYVGRFYICALLARISTGGYLKLALELRDLILRDEDLLAIRRAYSLEFRVQASGFRGAGESTGKENGK